MTSIMTMVTILVNSGLAQQHRRDGNWYGSAIDNGHEVFELS
jgi:hypothetical protein